MDYRKYGAPGREAVAKLLAEGLTSPSEIAKALGVSRQRVHQHLAKLEEDGRISGVVQHRPKRSA